MSNWATTGGDFGGASTWQHRKMCKTVSADGTIRCAASAEVGSDYCRHHDPRFELDVDGRIVGLKSAPKLVELPDVKRGIYLGGLPKSETAVVERAVVNRAEKIARQEAADAAAKAREVFWPPAVGSGAAGTHPYGTLVEERPSGHFSRHRIYHKHFSGGRTVVTTTRFNVVTRAETVLDWKELSPDYVLGVDYAADGEPFSR